MPSAPFVHASVLLKEVLGLLAPRPAGVYCDATLGGGGHAEAILEASSPSGQLVGIDRDPDAIEAARERLKRFGGRAILVHGRLGDIAGILQELGIAQLDGLLMDLGISSPQVDRGERGFSFQKTGPIDMRMDFSQGETALEFIGRLATEELASTIRRLGDERFAGPIARAIKEAWSGGALATTTDLAQVIARALPARERMQRSTDPATKTFQALRIAVNDELGDLARLLEDFPKLLRPGGILAAIAFHSLEDRLIKDCLRELAKHPGLPVDVATKMGIRPDPEIDLLTRHPIYPSDEEVALNPRARSARLRAGRRR